jgi:hypothetical protein
MARVRIEVLFYADLDRVPGWGHQPADWVKLITTTLERNEHYNTSVIIGDVDIIPDPQCAPELNLWSN